MFYRKVALVSALSVALLGGCVGLNLEEEVYVIFENAAKQEEKLFNDMQKLEKLETQEQELYAQIIQEGKENNEGIAPKIDQAVAKVNEREKVLKNEKEKFNQYTKEYNAEKLAFYKDAKIKIKVQQQG
ncbi:YkyA family protein [Bacillus sp. DX1.1]|uniref:YkyA family protein n=1 Tax=unclassified Bacillus (in: firmicutes) TaxID=185979 RepID=UPI00256FD354|nr:MULTISPECIES: YkyA family protein [unclassified Bacillus (in: firmicutes)]MDM5152511.1 YkyA family protein [Bacillus sp. DX1.1]WJE84444.1 YkyA family protein [Bacillus sp. DX3.1]